MAIDLRAVHVLHGELPWARHASIWFALTRRLITAGELVGIDVIDHIVLADTRYVSMKEQGRV